MYSPYQRNWIATLNGNLPYFLEDCPAPTQNDAAVRSSKKFSLLFDAPVPDRLQGFELEDSDRSKMCNVWPEGEEVALQVGGYSYSLAWSLNSSLCDSDSGGIPEQESPLVSARCCQPTCRRCRKF